MGDEIILEQFVDSLDNAVSELEKAVATGDSAKVSQWKVFVFDIHSKLSEMLKNV